MKSIFFFFIGKRTTTIPLSIYEEYFEKINKMVGKQFFIIDCPRDKESERNLRPRYPCGCAFIEIDHGRSKLYVLYNTKGIHDDTQDTLRVAMKYLSPDSELGAVASAQSVSDLGATEPERSGGKRIRTRRFKKYKTKYR